MKKDDLKKEDETQRKSSEPLEVTAPGQLPQLPQPQPRASIKGSLGRSERGRKKKTKDPVAGGKRKKTLSKDSTAPTAKEKTPAESILPDPRTRETKHWLVRSCALEKEQAEADKAFDLATKAAGKARNCSDTSTQEKNPEEEKELKAEKKKKKKKDDEQKEIFLNEKKHQDSPNAKSPEASSTMLEEMDFENRVMEMTHVKKLTTWKLSFVLMSNFFRLPIFLVVTKYYVTYGASFIGVCGLMMLAVGIPTVFLELSMGQFTSLPPNTFFARITPIAQGVGFSMIVLRCFALACIHVDVRYLFLFFQHVSLAGAPADDRCAHAGMPFCNTHKMCEGEQEAGLYGACIRPTTHDVAFKDSVLGEVMKLRALQSSPTQLLVENELSVHNVYVLFSQLALLLLSGVPLIDGAEFFSTIAPFLAMASFATPVVIFFFLEMDGDLNRFRAGWNGDMDGFADPFAWIVAFCLVMSMFNVGEGTWMFIGSWLNFRHKKVFRSLLYAVGCQLVLMFMMSFVFTAWAVNIVHYQHNGFLTHGETMAILRDRPLEFWLTLPTKVIPDKHDSYMFLAYFLFTVNSLGYLITTGEYLLVSMLRGFPFLVRVPKAQFRGTALLMMAGCSMAIAPFLIDGHVFKNAKVHYAYLAMMLVVIFYEMTIFVYIYGIQRVLVNLKVFYREFPPILIRFSRLTSYLKLCYRFIVMWLLMLGFAYATRYVNVNNMSLLSLIYLGVITLPWIIGFWKMARHSETTHAVVTLFRSDARFGPSAVEDRKSAATEENKMGSMGLH